MLSRGNALKGVGVCTFAQQLLPTGKVQRIPPAPALSTALCSGPGPEHCHLLTPALCICLLWKLLICNLKLFKEKKTKAM